MTTTEKQCDKAIASFNMYDSYMIVTYVDGTQDTQKVNFAQIRRQAKHQRTKQRRNFAKKYPGISVSKSMYRLFSLFAYKGYGYPYSELQELKKNHNIWTEIQRKQSKAQSIYKFLKYKKNMVVIDRLINRMFPGHDIGKYPKDWRVSPTISLSAPVGDLELAQELVKNQILPSNFFSHHE